VKTHPDMRHLDRPRTTIYGMASDVVKIHSSSFVEVPSGTSKEDARKLVDAALDDLVTKIRNTTPGKEYPAGSGYLVKNLREEIRRSDGGVMVTVTAELQIVSM